jgi:hypothetical protein
MPFPFPNFGLPFTLIPIFIGGIFLLVFGAIAFAITSSIAQWMSDNAAPVETFEARVIAKRTKATQNQSGDANTHSVSRWTSYSYFVTFEYSNGQRKEFGIKESEFGVLIEGDRGTLTFQGSRYKGFARHT